MGKKKACIFDLDGTLANTLTTIAYFGNRTLAAYGFPPIEEQEYRHMVGNGAKLLVKRMLDKSEAAPELFEQVLELYTQSYDNDPLYLTAPYPGISETLKLLKSSGIILAVLSNKPHSTVCKVVNVLFGTGLFTAVCGQREGVPLKPDPAPLLKMTAALGLLPTDCIYCGDTAVDIQTGKNAGIFTVGVSWGFRGETELRESGADAVIHSAEELVRFIK